MTVSHFDVWTTANGRAYQGVPYEVLADWLQQGRVVAADRVRPTGSDGWKPVGEFPTLAIYLPSALAAAPNDRTEALEPVELGFPGRRRRSEDDDDVDMVPLIDISLVLLIFFMMTATVAVGGATVAVPETRFATLTSDRSMVWVGMDLGPDAAPVYSLGVGEQAPASRDERLSLGEVIARVRERLERRESNQPVVVRIAAHHRLPFEAVQRLTAELTKLKPLGLAGIKAEVAERRK